MGRGRFIPKERVGGGGFGEVYRAYDRQTKNEVAIKKIDLKKHNLDVRNFREIAIMNDFRRVQHDNIVSLLHPVYEDKKARLCIVMPFYEFNMYDHKNKFENEYPGLRKDLLKGILKGVKACHDRGIVHRDLKPANILVDVSIESHTPKLADFGCSRSNFLHGDKLTPLVGTSCYRAPEMVLGSETYEFPVDLWGVGCIFFEMLTSEASLFNAHSQKEELRSILSVLGSPSVDQWPEARELPLGMYMPKMATPPELNESLQAKLPHITPLEMDLLSRLLTFNPRERITLDDALSHPYFLQ